MNKSNHKKSFLTSKGMSSFYSSIISILIGFAIGILIMFIISFVVDDINFGKGVLTLLEGPFTALKPIKAFGNMVFYAVPLIFTGLSVGIAYKTGLFNIGAPGQFLMGTLVSLLIALNIPSNGNKGLAVGIWLFAVVAGMLAGVIWGLIPGMLKALLGINEVIICIMTNWIAANMTTWIFESMTSLHNVGYGKSGYLITTATTGNGTPTLGLDKLTGNSYLDCSIIIAIVIAIFLWVFINKTSTGYSLRACGLNKFSAKYAGMHDKLNIILSMCIAGGLAALGGCFYYLNPGIEINYQSIYQSLPSYGFDGIPAALLANCNPIAIIFSSLFMRYISYSGNNLVSYGYNRYIADIIIAVIIYLSGFSRFFAELFGKLGKKKNDNYNNITGGSYDNKDPNGDGTVAVKDSLAGEKFFKTLTKGLDLRAPSVTSKKKGGK